MVWLPSFSGGRLRNPSACSKPAPGWQYGRYPLFSSAETTLTTNGKTTAGNFFQRSRQADPLRNGTACLETSPIPLQWLVFVVLLLPHRDAQFFEQGMEVRTKHACFFRSL